MVVATDCQQRRKILNRRFLCCVLLVSFPLSIVVFCLLGQIHYPVRQIGPCSWPFYIISKSCDGLSESVILPVNSVGVSRSTRVQNMMSEPAIPLVLTEQDYYQPPVISTRHCCEVPARSLGQSDQNS
jgi:hypothetical protein